MDSTSTDAAVVDSGAGPGLAVTVIDETQITADLVQLVQAAGRLAAAGVKVETVVRAVGRPFGFDLTDVRITPQG